MSTPTVSHVVRELLRDRETPAKQRQYALLALMNTDRAEDETFVEAALDDSFLLDVLLTNGQLITSQLRDVALPVKIHWMGLNPADVGFNYLRRGDSTTYSPPSLGFKDSTEQKAAFAKWSAFVSQSEFENSR